MAEEAPPRCPRCASPEVFPLAALFASLNAPTPSAESALLAARPQLVPFIAAPAAPRRERSRIPMVVAGGVLGIVSGYVISLFTLAAEGVPPTFLRLLVVIFGGVIGSVVAQALADRSLGREIEGTGARWAKEREVWKRLYLCPADETVFDRATGAQADARMAGIMVRAIAERSPQSGA